MIILYTHRTHFLSLKHSQKGFYELWKMLLYVLYNVHQNRAKTQETLKHE